MLMVITVAQMICKLRVYEGFKGMNLLLSTLLFLMCFSGNVWDILDLFEIFFIYLYLLLSLYSHSQGLIHSRLSFHCVFLELFI